MSSFEVLSEYLKSEYLALWALIVRSLSKSSREWCHPQSDVTKIRSQTKNDQPCSLFGYFIWVSLFGYFAPRINVSAKWCHISSPAALEGGLYEGDRGPRWVLFCQNASERAQAQREASTTSRLWALTHPHGPHPAHHHQSYPSQAPLGAQRPDTSGNNI